MITLRLYKDEDWRAITDAVEPFSPLFPSDSFLHIADRSIGVTGMEDDKVMACGGITFVNDDEGYVWVKVSRKCLAEGSKWLRVIRDVFGLMTESIDGLKLSSYVLEGFDKGDRLARIVGLKKTDKTEKYQDNIYCKYTVN